MYVAKTDAVWFFLLPLSHVKFSCQIDYAIIVSGKGLSILSKGPFIFVHGGGGFRGDGVGGIMGSC